MNKPTILVAYVLIALVLISAEFGSNASPIHLPDKQELDLLRKTIIEHKIEQYEQELDEKLTELSHGSRKSKRSDIDARLMELQAKILLAKAYSKMPPGYGMFNFHEIGKRSIEFEPDEMTSVLEELLKYEN